MPLNSVSPRFDVVGRSFRNANRIEIAGVPIRLSRL